CQKYYIPPYSF
nr:immunoglobulin light chain junction region [Macaca mulatta]